MSIDPIDIGLPIPLTMSRLLDLGAMVYSNNGTAQAYVSSHVRDNLADAIEGAVDECGTPEDYVAPDPPLLDVGPALGILSGIGNAEGCLADFIGGLAGAFLKSLIQELLDSVPHP